MHNSLSSNQPHSIFKISISLVSWLEPNIYIKLVRRDNW
jgi:hypothetical protein